MNFTPLLNTKEYAFLYTNPRLGSRIMLLGVSGSYGYGTNREESDIDFRGVALNLPSDLIGLTSFEQYEDAVDMPLNECTLHGEIEHPFRLNSAGFPPCCALRNRKAVF